MTCIVKLDSSFCRDEEFLQPSYRKWDRGAKRKRSKDSLKEIPFMHSATLVTASLKPWLQIIILRDSRLGIEPHPLRTGREPVSRKRGNDQKPNLSTHLIQQTMECSR